MPQHEVDHHVNAASTTCNLHTPCLRGPTLLRCRTFLAWYKLPCSCTTTTGNQRVVNVSTDFTIFVDRYYRALLPVDLDLCWVAVWKPSPLFHASQPNDVTATMFDCRTLRRCVHHLPARCTTFRRRGPSRVRFVRQHTLFYDFPSAQRPLSASERTSRG
jgi:hypothetical protein